MNKVKLGEILVNEKFITTEQLHQALEEEKETNKQIDKILIDMNLISESDMLKSMAKSLSLEYIENPMNVVDEGMDELIPLEFARAHLIIPLYIRNDILYVATNDPLNFSVLEDLSAITQMDTFPVISPLKRIEQTISSLYSLGDEDEEDTSPQKISEEEAQLMSRVDSAPIVKLVNSLIVNAYNENASDIHLEPGETRTLVRFRKDGYLSEHTVLRKEIHDLVATRIKIIANMNIAEKRVPQDGSFRIKTEYVQVDLRVSSIPTTFGEKIVIRLLGADKTITYNLDDVDFAADVKAKLRRIITAPNGIILVTGPTGSGKTTTLYSLLAELTDVEHSVVTVEDPIEKQFDGITQVQINTKAGLTFAAGLRSILRQDPDIIMVGEIRDAETASIAIRAAITGHLVLSTLHTNDALSSVVRLVDMGVEPYLVASSIKAVIAQRLVRKVCRHCAYKAPTALDDRLLLGEMEMTEEMRGGGCERCNHTGYDGRIAVFEIVFIDERLQEMISERASMKELIEYVRAQKVQFLKDDVIRLIKEGKTTVQEARRILFSIE